MKIVLSQKEAMVMALGYIANGVNESELALATILRLASNGNAECLRLVAKQLKGLKSYGNHQS